MRKLKIVAPLLIVLLITFFNTISSHNDNTLVDFNMAYLGKISSVDAEADCSEPGSTYIQKRPKTGDSCYCDASNKWIIPQTCESGGSGCTEIPECD